MVYLFHSVIIIRNDMIAVLLLLHQADKCLASWFRLNKNSTVNFLQVNLIQYSSKIFLTQTLIYYYIIAASHPELHM